MPSNNYNKNCNTHNRKKRHKCVSKSRGDKAYSVPQFQKVGGLVPLSTLRSTPMVLFMNFERYSPSLPEADIPQPRPVHSLWLVSLCGMGFRCRKDCSPGFFLTHSP